MHKPSLFSRLLLAGTLTALTASLLPAVPSYAAQPRQGDGPAQVDPQTTNALTPRAHMPLMLNSWPLTTVFGIETVNYTAGQASLVASNATWIRRNALQWKDVEASPGQRNWDAGLDADLINASKNGQKVVLIVHGTPTWARTVPTSNCSPIQPGQLPAFASFMRDAVNRYSKAPYNVKYWELWNEPDAPVTAGVNTPYGCWGNPADPYFGGGEYANMLKTVSPQIRQVDPQAKIVLGGLLLDCNPNQAAACASAYPKMGLYLQGILVNGGAPHFDVVSFHAYDFYLSGSNTAGAYASPSWSSRWNTTGPVLIAKTQFIRSVLSQFGVGDKQLMNTEVGVLCFLCSNLSPAFLDTKAYYVPQAYAAAMAVNLLGNVWYSYEGWEGSALDGTALVAFKVARAKLGGLTYAGEIGAGDVGSGGVKGYKFTRSGKAVWVIWSLDGATKNVTLPGMPATVTDALGAVQPAGASFPLTIKPLYVEFP